MKNINDVAGTDTVTIIPDLPPGKHEFELPIMFLGYTGTEEENIEEVESKKTSVEQAPHSECSTQPVSVHKEKLPMNTTLSDAPFSKIYQEAIEKIEMEYVDGALAYIRKYHPNLHNKIKDVENDAESIWQTGDTNRLVEFKGLLDKWVLLSLEGIRLFSPPEQHVCNEKHGNSGI